MSKTSYAILKDAPNNSFINPNFSHKPALVLKDGTLFIVIDKYLYKSDDSGFTWVRKQKDVMGVGTTQYLGNIYFFSGQVAENDADPITCVELSYVRDYAGGPAVKIEFGGGEAGTYYPGISNSTHGRWHFLVDDDVYYDYGALVTAGGSSVAEIINQPDGGTDWFDSITDGTFAGIFTRAYATEDTWAVADMLIRNPDNPVYHEDRGVTTYDYINRFAAYGRHCVVSSDEAPDRMIHINVTDFATPTIAETVLFPFTGTLNCVSMDKDAYGNLMFFWTDDSDGAGTLLYYVGYSLNDGASWTYGDVGPLMGGINPVVNTPVDIMGCENGFIIIYVREKDVSGTPRLYSNTIKSTDGATYTVSTPVEACSSPSGVAVYGGHFFRPDEDVWYDLDKAGDIRIAYKAGNDIEQELLSETAYPSSPVVADTGTNQDFINVAGASGDITGKYLKAFDELGVTCSFHKYVPYASGKMDDISTYGEATDSEHIVIIDPETYNFPIPDLSTPETTDYIEQDVRKVFIPPNFHLDREFLVNEGNFLKRTVWTMDYDGNEYEVSQVVPRFLDEQICFYSSNAYVIGQSRDPWTRDVLLSET